MQTPLSTASGSFGWVWSTEALSSSLKLHQGGLNYSFELQRHTGQTTVLQALTLGHMGSNYYSTTKIFVKKNFIVDVVDNVD